MYPRWVRAHRLVALNLVPPEQSLHSDMGRYFPRTKALLCQSASKRDPLSACKRDPFAMG